MTGRYAWADNVAPRPAKEISHDVFVHVKAGPGAGNWLNVTRQFIRLPIVGEYLMIEDGGPFFRVDIVLHCPHGNIGAELYCTQVEWQPIQRAHSGTLNWDE